MVLAPTLGVLGLLSAFAGCTEKEPEPARYVRIELPGAARILSLAEVQVFSEEHSVGVRGAATQSSEASGGAASRAIDGNTSGVYTQGSVTHTGAERDAWWELDLGEELPIDRVVVWNRTDCCGERLNGFTVQLLDKRHRLLWERGHVPAPYPTVEIVPYEEAPELQLGPTAEQRRAYQPQIDAAIDAGVDFLLAGQLWDGSFRQHSEQYPAGSTGLALYTLLKCEVPKDHPAVIRAAMYLAAHPPAQTYEIGTVLMALDALGDPDYHPFMEELLDELLSFQGARGGDGKRDAVWAYPIHSEIADLSNTQYAALGLRAAEHAGLRIPPRVWLSLLEGVLRYQEEPREVADTVTLSTKTTSGKLRIAGFPYRTGGAATSSMTTAGLGIVGICEEGLGELPAKLRTRVRNAKQYGTGWLAYNFSVETNVAGGANWLAYYLYGLERVGALLGIDLIGVHDWYWEGAHSLVAKQGDNGSWSSANECDTCFALLFLARATARRDTGGEKVRAVPEGSWISEDPSLDVQWRITGGDRSVFFVTGFSEAVREQHGLGSGRALSVQRVEYLIDGEPLASVPGDTTRAWAGERFAARHDFERRGSYRCEVRVCVKSPGAVDGVETTAELRGEPLTVVIEDAHDARLLEYPRHAASNLLRETRVTASASTENSPGQSAAKAIDGMMGTGWMAAKDEPTPSLVVELARAQRGRVLLLTQANVNESGRGQHDRATRVRVVLNGKSANTYELEMPASDEQKCVLELEKPLSLRRVEITILERVAGSKWPGHVGINEVEWIDD